MNMFCRISWVVRYRLAADIVNRLLEGCGATNGLGQRCGRAPAPVTSHDSDGVGFVHVQVGVVQAADRADLDQRDRDAGPTNRQRNGFEGILEAELERD